MTGDFAMEELLFLVKPELLVAMALLGRMAATEARIGEFQLEEEEAIGQHKWPRPGSHRATSGRGLCARRSSSLSTRRSACALTFKHCSSTVFEHMLHEAFKRVNTSSDWC